MTNTEVRTLIKSHRDIVLVYRYYYLHEIERLRHDDCIRKLAYEIFFLSEFSINRIIQKHESFLQDLIKENPDPSKVTKRIQDYTKQLINKINHANTH
jgi:hypothetical protein